jgi:hypothetical protein
MLIGEFWAILETKKQQFNTPGFMPVDFSKSFESVELGILQVGEKLNELQDWQICTQCFKWPTLPHFSLLSVNRGRTPNCPE